MPGKFVGQMPATVHAGNNLETTNTGKVHKDAVPYCVPLLQFDYAEIMSYARSWKRSRVLDSYGRKTMDDECDDVPRCNCLALLVIVLRKIHDDTDPAEDRLKICRIRRAHA